MREDEFRTFENSLGLPETIQGLVRFAELRQCPGGTGDDEGELKEDVARPVTAIRRSLSERADDIAHQIPAAGLPRRDMTSNSPLT